MTPIDKMPLVTDVKQMVQIILIMLGVVGLIAILALVFGSIAYANLSTRSARRDALFYAGAQRRADGVPREPITLYTETVNKTVQPGSTEVINSVSIDTKNATVSAGTGLAISLTVNREGASDAAAGGHVVFVGNSANFAIPSMVGVYEAAVSFTYGQVAGGGMQPVTLTNTGTIPLRVSRVRVLTQSRYYTQPQPHSSSYSSAARATAKGRGGKRGRKSAGRTPRKRGFMGIRR